MSDFKQSVDKQRKVIAKKLALVEKQQAILTEILTECPHEELKEESYHFSGSYYDKAYTETWMRCVVCGNRGESTIDHHSWYG
jgi:DNA-directed RNA polymerase subunit M/transcription elongation factor TFIIS